MGSGSKPSCSWENSPQTCLVRETCPPPYWQEQREVKLMKNLEKSREPLCRPEVPERFPWFDNTPTRFAFPLLPMSMPPPCWQQSLCFFLFGSRIKGHLQHCFPSKDLKCVILVRLQARQCHPFSFRRLVQHLPHLPLSHGAIVDSEAFEQAVHRLWRRRLPRESKGGGGGGGAGER